MIPALDQQGPGQPELYGISNYFNVLMAPLANCGAATGTPFLPGGKICRQQAAKPVGVIA
jgi:hypothetical protein